jgi:hypothetical protein
MTSTPYTHSLFDLPAAGRNTKKTFPDTYSTPPRAGWVKDPAGAAKRRGRSPASFTQTSMVAGLQSGVGLTPVQSVRKKNHLLTEESAVWAVVSEIGHGNGRRSFQTDHGTKWSKCEHVQFNQWGSTS